MTVLKYALAAGSLIAAALWLHANVPLTAALDLMFIAASLIILAWCESRCIEVEWKEWRDRPPSAATYRRLEWAVKLLAVTAALIYGAFLVRHGSLEDFFQRRQEAKIIEQADRLQGTGEHRAAAEFIESHLRRRLLADTRVKLQLRLLECWLSIAERADAAERAALVAHAETLVRQGLIDHTALANLQRHVNRIAAHAQQLAELTQSAAATVANERAARQTAEAIAGHRAEQLQIQAKETADKIATADREHAARHFGTLLAWSESLTADLPLQRDKFQEAIEFGRQWQFDHRTADERLHAVLQAIREAQPQDLPTGSSAKWVSFHSDHFPPALTCELLVMDPQNRPIEGLRASDFRASVAKRPLTPIASAYLAPSQQRLQIVILVDCSGSTAGQALAAAKAGIGHLLSVLSGQADVCLIAFNTSTTPLSSWEADPRALTGRLAGMQSAGGTAIYGALDVAAAALQQRASPRLIVLFTDGKDSTGVQPARTLDRLRTEQIVVHAVGLETAEFDRLAIERLTTATGGMLLTASQAPELAKRFAELSVALNVPRYRLVIPCQQAAGALQITVGGKNAAVLERSLDTAALPPLAKQ